MTLIHRTACFTLTIAVALASTAHAQSSQVNDGVVRKTERNARANWQPVRAPNPAATQTGNAAAIRQAGHAIPNPPTSSRTSNRQPTRVRLANTRTTSGSVTVMEGPILQGPIYEGEVYEGEVYEGEVYGGEIYEGAVIHEPLDGQIALAPIYGQTACDAMPMDGYGCNSISCAGGCDSPSCCNFSAGSCNSCCGELCSPDTWRPCITLSLPTDGWVSFEYLSWWQDGMSLPPLVTTSSDPNTPQAQAGVLGQGNTRILFGGNEVLTDNFDGGRLRFGFWLDKCHTWGIGAEYFQLGSESESFFANSNGNPILARPFFNVNPGSGSPREDSELIAFAGPGNTRVSGSVSARAESELVGGGIHLRRLQGCNEGCNRWLFDSCEQPYCSRTEMMLGYRYLQLTESVGIQENLTGISPQANFAISDDFRTQNQFNGFDIGWNYRQTRRNWTFDGQLRLGVGVTRQSVGINGSTIISADPSNPGNKSYAGGLLAQPSNIGTFDRDEFSVIPEFGVNLGYQLNDHWRAMFGYTFIYWSNVVRPGEHISRDLNPGQLPPAQDPLEGAARPEFAFNSVDYWVQGISTGLEYRW